jgi:hypothetical protein
MTYCECEFPVIDVEHDAGCRRCGAPVDFSPSEPDAGQSVRVEVLEARRQERLDRLAGNAAPATWGSGEAGAVELRLVAAAALVAVLVAVVVFAWPYLVGAGVMVAGWRVATRHTRRRRPRSSWSSLGRTAALMYAAWNSRWLRGSTLRASVPAAVGREHVDTDGVPF